MSDVLRLALWLRSATGWTFAAVLLGVATVAANTGLLSTATYLASAAAAHPPLLALAGALALVRLFGLSRPFVRYAERLISHDVTFRLLAQLRLWLFGRLVGLAPGQLLALRSADLLARLVRDVDEAQTVFQHLVAPLIVALMTILMVAVAFWSIDAQLGAVASASLVGVGLGLPALALAAARRSHVEQIQRRAELDVRIADTLYGLPDLLAFGQAAAQLDATFRLDTAIERGQQRLATIAGVRVAAHDVTVRLGAWIILLLAIRLVTTHMLDPTYLAVLPIVLLGAVEAVEPLAHAAQRVGATRAAAGRIWAIADRCPAVTFPVDSADPVVGNALEFRDVGFTYDGPPVLADVSFTLRRGQAIGIIGPSGAGKSTLLQLAVRGWDPTTGQVRLDGRDLRRFSAEALTSTIGLLTHDSYIFSGTLRENLQLARPSATDGDMYRALSAAGLADLVAELPRGLDTCLGEQGARMSGGERQRLAIARVLLLETPFLLFDEPTANLDPVTERRIMAAVRTASRTRGVLLVTHRLVDLDSLDELLVLDGGRIVERGRAADLQRRGGPYARLFHVQQQVLISG
jgi:ATP-binding cassette, subfamily C, bacterial CydC